MTTKHTEQLRVWTGEFGDAYSDRNAFDWRMRVPAFRHMIVGSAPRRVLEVGCNKGNNLLALSEILPDTDVVGVEPNTRALAAARSRSPRVSALRGNAFDLPFKDSYFDLVLTAGVLIHIALSDLPGALAEIYRVSRRYLLSIEYFAEQDTLIHYRGFDNLLWKRNFLKHYQDQFSDLTLVRSGYWGPDDGFDKCHWWLLEKPPRDSK